MERPKDPNKYWTIQQLDNFGPIPLDISQFFLCVNFLVEKVQVKDFDIGDKIHQALLSQISLTAEFFMVKVTIKN